MNLVSVPTSTVMTRRTGNVGFWVDVEFIREYYNLAVTDLDLEIRARTQAAYEFDDEDRAGATIRRQVRRLEAVRVLADVGYQVIVEQERFSDVEVKCDSWAKWLRRRTWWCTDRQIRRLAGQIVARQQLLSVAPTSFPETYDRKTRVIGCFTATCMYAALSGFAPTMVQPFLGMIYGVIVAAISLRERPVKWDVQQPTLPTVSGTVTDQTTTGEKQGEGHHSGLYR